MTLNSRQIVSAAVSAALIKVLEDHRIYIHAKAKKLTFSTSVKIEPYVSFGGSTLCEMGAMSFVNLLPTGREGANVKIGRYCSLPRFFINAPRHPVEAVTTSPFCYSREKRFIRAAFEDFRGDRPEDYQAPSKTKVLNTKTGVNIQNDVWFGSDVALNPGVTVGTGAIVAAHSLVTKDIPPYEIWGGNPARRLKARFDNDISCALLESRWWEYSPGDLATLPLSDPEIFLKEFEGASKSLLKYQPDKVHLYSLLLSDGIEVS